MRNLFATSPITATENPMPTSGHYPLVKSRVHSRTKNGVHFGRRHSERCHALRFCFQLGWRQVLNPLWYFWQAFGVGDAPSTFSDSRVSVVLRRNFRRLVSQPAFIAIEVVHSEREQDFILSRYLVNSIAVILKTAVTRYIELGDVVQVFRRRDTTLLQVRHDLGSCEPVGG